MRISDLIRRAIEIGEPDGIITFDELNQLCGNEAHPEDIEAIMSSLSEAGINLVEAR